MSARMWPTRQYDDPPDLALDWMSQAVCAETDPEAFFPEKGGSPRTAKQVCFSCEVRAECLAYALASAEGEFGVWGGTTEKERRRLRLGLAA